MPSDLAACDKKMGKPYLESAKGLGMVPLPVKWFRQELLIGPVGFWFGAEWPVCQPLGCLKELSAFKELPSVYHM